MFTRMNVGPGKWSTTCVVLLFAAAALQSAAPASADPNDDAFVSALAKDGIAVADPNTTIGMAHTVCAGFDNNEKSSVLAMRLKKDYAGLSLKQASYFVGVSVSAYCPQYIGHTDDSLRWMNPRPPIF
jgi:hypothetical protein